MRQVQLLQSFTNTITIFFLYCLVYTYYLGIPKNRYVDTFLRSPPNVSHRSYLQY